MYANWIPQNIQKRLLLYILQQLSLFSEVDLPNLEQVSLNNIHLKDISIDPEKVAKIPGFRLRHGKFHDITLKGGVVDGVNFDVAGLDLVLAPSIDNIQQDIKDAHNLLVQSTADLTRSVLLDEPGLPFLLPLARAQMGEPHSPPTLESSEELGQYSNQVNVKDVPLSVKEPTSAAVGAKKVSSLGGVMSKAVELALLRLQVKITNITIKLVVEPVVLLMEIDEIKFQSKNGLKGLKVSGVKVSTVSPTMKSGHVSKSQTPATHKPYTKNSPEQGPKHGQASETELDSDDSANDDHDPELDSSLHSSTVFTHEEASSIYMSATSLAFEPKPESAQPAAENSILLYIDSMNFSFEGVSPLENLRINLGTVRLSAVPLVPTLSLVFNSLSKIVKLLNHQLCKRNARARSNPSDLSDSEEEDQEETEEPHQQSFSTLQTRKLELSFTSALNKDGSFASTDDDLSLILDNISVRQKSTDNFCGGVETLVMKRFLHGEESFVFGFETDQSKDTGGPRRADIRFEYQTTSPKPNISSELSTLISKPGLINIDVDTAKYLTNVLTSVDMIVENFGNLAADFRHMTQLSNPQTKNSSKNSQSLLDSHQIIVKTSTFDIKLKVGANSTLSLRIKPITFNLLSNETLIEDLALYYRTSGPDTHLFTVPSVKIQTTPKALKYKQFNSSSFLSISVHTLCPKAINVDRIKAEIAYGDLQILINDFSSFADSFLLHGEMVNCVDLALTKSKETEKVKGHAPNTLQNSIYSNQSRLKKLRGTLIVLGERKSPSVLSSTNFDAIEFVIRDVNKSFGNIKLLIEGVKLFQTLDGISGLVHGVNFTRRIDTKVETFLQSIHQGTNDMPMFQWQVRRSGLKLSFDVAIRLTILKYYSSWTLLLGSEENFSVPSAQDNELSPKKKSSLFESNIVMFDMMIEIAPTLLPSRLALAAGKSTLEVKFEGPSKIFKGLLRDNRILLVDNRKHVIKSHGQETYASLLSYYVEKGFTDLGAIDALHFGLTLNDALDVQAQKNFPINEQLSVTEMKLNVGALHLGLCADTYHTLVQTLNDVTPNRLLADEEKFRVKVDKSFKMPSDIIEELKSLIVPRELPQAATEISDTDIHKPDEFVVVESYMETPKDGTRNTEELQTKDEEAFLSNEEGVLKLLVFDDHFSNRNTDITRSIVPFSLKMHVTKIELYLYDGFDWAHTRKGFRQSFEHLEASAKNSQPFQSSNAEQIQEHQGPPQDVIDAAELSDTQVRVSEQIFGSIILSAEVGDDVEEAIRDINRKVQGYNEDKLPSELPRAESSSKKLNLERSLAHKVSANVSNLSLSVLQFDSDGSSVNEPETDFELLNEIRFNMETFAVTDNVETSTWNRFLTYMSSVGERESGSNMLELTLKNVRPDLKLSYTEAVVHASVLPLRLYIDQDTLDFLIRFFDFKDERFKLPPDEEIFLQSLTIDRVRLKFDYKPKKVDFAGLKAGRSAEFANFFILEGLDLDLKEVKVNGFLLLDLGTKLGAIYGPHIQKTQIAGLLAGLPPVRTAFNLGSGVKELFTLPLREYKEDGRVIYGLQKGAKRFARTTVNELLNLGVKLASGTQVVLEALEEYFGGEGQRGRQAWIGSEEKEVVSKIEKPRLGQARNLVSLSQLLRERVKAERPSSDKPQRYVYSDIDEDDDDLDTLFQEMQGSILVLGDGSELSDDDETDEPSREHRKVVSLYSGQPETTRDGLRLAYKAFGKNLSSTRRKLYELRSELRETDSFQDQARRVVRSTPVLVIRPMIGTTEAMMKTLMGLRNSIDLATMRESQDKYRSEELFTG